MIFPPPGGPALLSVVETNFANATRQEIALASNARTPGENHITITRFLADGGDGSDGELADTLLTDANLAGEMAAAFPDVAMTVSPYYAQNAYGPFGYAMGRASTGDTCVYAWQRIAPTPRPSGKALIGATSIRLALCDRASDEPTLLAMMYRMRLREAPFEPFRAPVYLGAPGAPIVPASLGDFAAVLDPAPARPTTPAQPATPAPRPATPTGPTVPLPGGGTQTGDSGTTPVVPLPPGQ